MAFKKFVGCDGDGRMRASMLCCLRTNCDYRGRATFSCLNGRYYGA